ncbi:NUDIX hydrolase [Roseicitreum antarcticum]|uniref:8-oxo-dGTP pyrophosphatase MutT, NUDIX family n=1 Tax=Roseicitreum antarcticum TaxID=564137 RepID=A0A1H3C3C5_9RHOB|nr:NUDIX hydrolase [Roseicitreum antarcticum]SDX48672.1 8-oxo-dGTP pyrophosphatase MutT, NUDIX family [Roseicitreum antarcticum]
MTAAPAGMPIRPAATVLAIRPHADGPRVLMGQRGAGAAFMPDKFVFPGGAVDADDALVPLSPGLDALCHTRLSDTNVPPAALAAAAIREMWEETGLMLGRPGTWPGAVPTDWAGFAARGMVPSADGLRFIFRAITPPGRSRRFDARFFMVDAAGIAGDPDNFEGACDELRCLQWVPLAEARALNLPFITEVVLAEAARIMRTGEAQRFVPFFDSSGPASIFRQIP